jgi:hypothetical protein
MSTSINVKDPGINEILLKNSFEVSWIFLASSCARQQLLIIRKSGIKKKDLNTNMVYSILIQIRGHQKIRNYQI